MSSYAQQTEKHLLLRMDAVSSVEHGFLSACAPLHPETQAEGNQQSDSPAQGSVSNTNRAIIYKYSESPWYDLSKGCVKGEPHSQVSHLLTFATITSFFRIFIA